MWNFFRRRHLLGRGLASPKKRRTVCENPVARVLSRGKAVRGAILGLFVLGLAGLVFTGQQQEPAKKFLLCLLIFLTALAQLWVNHPRAMRENSRLTLVLGVLFAQLAAIKLVLGQAAAGAFDLQLAPLLVPYAFAPLTLSVLLGGHYGMFAAVFCSLWGSLLVGRIDPVFLVISLITGFVAVFLTLQVRRRSRLVRAGIYVGAVTWVLAAAFGQIGPIIWEALHLSDWKMIGLQSLAAVGVGFGTAILVSGLLPALESLFHITTEISWVEMSDLNHPLLRRLSLEAPGTFHHSLAVANLAEAAAEKTGANPTICRVCSYFHDIGKLIKPEYFTENIRSGENPHDELTPTMSALIIISHVKDGADLALKHKLIQEIRDAIQQHHGTSLVSYFYQRALQQQEDARLGGKILNVRPEDVPEVHEETFRYPGPKPTTKETAIVSLADSVESASRCLEHPSPQRISDLVEKIIRDRVEDGQLDVAPLTFADLQKIGKSFESTLVNMLHARVAYPNAKRPEEEPTTGRNRQALPAA